jgi:hypothetical protein
MKFVQIANDGGLLPVPDRARLVRAVAGQAARVRRRLHQVHGRHADQEGRRHLPDQRHEDAERPDVGNSSRFSPDPNYKVPVMKIVIGDDAPDNSVIPPALDEAAAPCRRCRATGRPAEQPADLRGRARQRRRRDRVADQRQAVRPDQAADQPEEPGRQDAARPAEDGQLQPVGDPQRRRRLGAPVPPAHGGAPHRHAQRQGRHRRPTRAPRRRLGGGPGRARPERVGDHLPRFRTSSARTWRTATTWPTRTTR